MSLTDADVAAVREAVGFKALSESQIDFVKKRAHALEYARRTLLARKGEHKPCLYVVVRGWLEIEDVPDEPHKKHGFRFRTLGERAVVGWSVVAGAAHSANVWAAAGTRVAIVEDWLVAELIGAAATPFVYEAWKWMGGVIGALSAERRAAIADPLVERTRDYLLNEAHQRHRNELKLTEEQLHQMGLGERTRVGEALNQLAEEGFLSRPGRGRVVVNIQLPQEPVARPRWASRRPL